MARAIWNGAVIAESETVQQVDGYTYFPHAAVNPEHVRPSEHVSVCGWKGTATHFDLLANGEVNPEAAWTYADPKPAAEHIRGWISFWRGVHVQP
jgi:uncharacterized protein (DUF427 family)